MSTLMNPDKYAASGTEQAAQTALFMWAAEQALLEPAIYSVLKYMYAIPNGGERNIAVAARLRAAGVKRGVPDICLPLHRAEYGGLYLEMKAADTGVVSNEQLEYLHFLYAQNYAVAVAHGYDDAKLIVDSYVRHGTLPPGAILRALA